MAETRSDPAPPAIAGSWYGSVALAADGPYQLMAAILDRAGIATTVHESVEAMLEQPPEPSPGLVVLWIEEPVSVSLAPLERLAQRFADAPVLVVCQEIKRWGARAALTAGAAGVVHADELEDALVATVHALLAGQACVPRGHWQQLEPPALSTREKQVLGLAAMGYMNSQIAGRLFLAESTVKSHLSSIFGKLGVRSRHEAADLVLDFERGLGIDIGVLTALAPHAQSFVGEQPLPGPRRARSST